MNDVNQLIITFVELSENRGRLLDFPLFVEMWRNATWIAENGSPDVVPSADDLHVLLRDRE